jgi:hypothetical protein
LAYYANAADANVYGAHWPDAVSIGRGVDEGGNYEYTTVDSGSYVETKVEFSVNIDPGWYNYAGGERYTTGMNSMRLKNILAAYNTYGTGFSCYMDSGWVTFYTRHTWILTMTKITMSSIHTQTSSLL